ncbi:tyrosine-type recombinase/integrase [Pseudalkalibacillus sp. A8]|uniref:tyrosine-type recombinase/integrase n=1 Tax=Pseudalkalibacillus sp. A8 TaxID=3382641 RepID=UPI0038B467C1
MLIEMMEKDFIQDKKYEGLTESSLGSYVDFFKLWNEWLSEEGIEHTEELSPRVAKKFLIWCQEEKENKPQTVNTKLKLLRVFARWLKDEGVTDELFTKGVKAQRQDDSPKIMREEDLQQALRHLRRTKRREDSFTARRNYALLMFLAGTGLRLSELERATWRDIDLKDYLINIPTSKSRKTQSVPLSESLAREMLDWRLYLERKFQDRFPEALFVTREGKPLSKSAVQNFFKRLKKKLGLQGDFSPHCMRNFYIKQLLKGGANLREVQLLARHGGIHVTKRYIGYFNHELKETLDKANPLRSLL